MIAPTSSNSRQIVETSSDISAEIPSTWRPLVFLSKDYFFQLVYEGKRVILGGINAAAIYSYVVCGE